MSLGPLAIYRFGCDLKKSQIMSVAPTPPTRAYGHMCPPLGSVTNSTSVPFFPPLKLSMRRLPSSFVVRCAGVHPLLSAHHFAHSGAGVVLISACTVSSYGTVLSSFPWKMIAD